MSGLGDRDGLAGLKYAGVRLARHGGINGQKRIDIIQINPGDIGARGRLQPGVDHGAELKTGTRPLFPHILQVRLDQIQQPRRLDRDVKPLLFHLFGALQLLSQQLKHPEVLDTHDGSGTPRLNHLIVGLQADVGGLVAGAMHHADHPGLVGHGGKPVGGRLIGNQGAPATGRVGIKMADIGLVHVAGAAVIFAVDPRP